MHLIKIISFFLIDKNIREPEPLILHDSTATTTLKSNQIHYCHLRNWQPPPHFSFSLIHTPKPTSQTYNCYLWCKSSLQPNRYIYPKPILHMVAPTKNQTHHHPKMQTHATTTSPNQCRQHRKTKPQCWPNSVDPLPPTNTNSWERE